MSDAGSFDALVGELAPIGLADLEAAAALQSRVDRKYVVTAELASGLVAALGPGARVLERDSSRSAPYESVYFDTPDRWSYLDATRARPRRAKVRTRLYGDGACTLEVKSKARRGTTVKVRTPHDPARRDALDEAAAEFIGAVAGPAVPVARLGAALTTAYVRTTLLGPDGRSRLTVDRQVTCVSTGGAAVGMPGWLVVETKSQGPPTAADRWLWHHGARPQAFSKYCVGLAALDAGLPANRWARSLRRYVRPADAQRARL